MAENSACEKIPVFDLDALGGASRDALDDACRHTGFFQLRGHGIPVALQREVRREAERFFALPRDAKARVERSARNVWGWYDRELTKNRRDWKEIFDVGPAEEAGPLAGASPQWPAEQPALRTALTAYADACAEVCREILAAISENLCGRREALAESFEPEGCAHTSFLRLNRYPPCESPAPADAPRQPVQGELGIHHHTDAGALTLVLQDEQPGLQVELGGRWHVVPPIPDALVVNLGDVVQVWSNDAYPAPLHRVLASRQRARAGVAYFYNPAYAARYAPVQAPPRYHPIHWGEFRAGRSAGDYADQGEEIQISQYRRSP